MKPWRNSSVAFLAPRKLLMQNAFSPIHGHPDSHPVSTTVLEGRLVCARDVVVEAEARLVAEPSAHILFRGAAGVGKTHCAEILVRRLAERHGWRVVRLSPSSHFLQGFGELVATIAERDSGVTRAWEEPVPGAAISVETLRARERETGRPLALLLEDLPGVLERTLRGADIRRFINLLRQLHISVVATARTTRLGRAARPLLAQFDEIHIPELDRPQTDELVLRCAHEMGDSPDSPAVACTRTLRPILGGNPRLITTLYRIAHGRMSSRVSVGRDTNAVEHVVAALMEHMAPYFRALLDALSPQQALVLTRLALAPGTHAGGAVGTAV